MHGPLDLAVLVAYEPHFTIGLPDDLWWHRDIVVAAHREVDEADREGDAALAERSIDGLLARGDLIV